jgi:phage shock protein E
MFKSISKEEAREMVLKNEFCDSFIVIDVRTPDELKGGVIGNPININIFDADFKQRISKLDRKKTYLVYCRSGNRSSAAVELMKQLKFEQVYHLENGML